MKYKLIPGEGLKLLDNNNSVKFFLEQWEDYRGEIKVILI